MMNGIWIAYYADWSGVAVFDEEIDALRYAVGKGMEVFHVPFGLDLREAVADA